MSRQPVTVDEIIALLRHSGIPTLLVEGPDDAEVCRSIERRFQKHNLSLLVCGGRDALLKVYERRAEFSSKQVAFLADRDLWLFTGLPEGLDGIIWTAGYSIENDLYAKELEELFDESELRDFQMLLDSICTWFGLAVDQNLASFGSVPIDTHINQLTGPNSFALSADCLTKLGLPLAPSAKSKEVRSDYAQLLRGKQLFQCLVRILNAPTRKTKHSRSSLCELSMRCFRPTALLQLEQSIASALGLVPISGEQDTVAA